jgi:hypothetical protein
MCVAGWASAIFAPPNAVFRDGVSFINEFGEHQTVSSYAQEILGFSDEQAQVLFYSLPNKAIIPALKYLVSNPDASGSVLHRKFMEL